MKLSGFTTCNLSCPKASVFLPEAGLCPNRAAHWTPVWSCTLSLLSHGSAPESGTHKRCQLRCNMCGQKGLRDPQMTERTFLFRLSSQTWQTLHPYSCSQGIWTPVLKHHILSTQPLPCHRQGHCPHISEQENEDTGTKSVHFLSSFNSATVLHCEFWAWCPWTISWGLSTLSPALAHHHITIDVLASNVRSMLL